MSFKVWHFLKFWNLCKSNVLVIVSHLCHQTTEWQKDAPLDGQMGNVFKNLWWEILIAWDALSETVASVVDTSQDVQMLHNFRYLNFLISLKNIWYSESVLSIYWKLCCFREFKAGAPLPPPINTLKTLSANISITLLSWWSFKIFPLIEVRFF